jgi:F1F0 ATPase subunit 2
MMMTDTLGLVSAALAGLGLGAMFFGGLWWTVQRTLSAKQPGVWMFGSLTLRVVGVLAGFYAVGRDDWRRWVACLAAFVLVRIVAMRLVARNTRDKFRAQPGVADASES